MELIQNNPYRIAGILSNGTERELQRQKGRITAHARVGQETESDLDFQFLPKISRKEIDVVNKAFANLQQNQDKVNYALFWFFNASPFDNTAFDYLKNGDEDKALEIWEKVTTDKDVNSKNFSAFNNLGTYKLLSRDKSDIKTGVEAKMKLIESDYFESLVESVTDQYFKTDKQKQAETLIDELLTQFKNQFSSSEILHLFSGCNGTTQKYLTTKFTEEPLHRIETQIETCKKKRKDDKWDAYQFGLNLFHNTKDDLSLLKSLLSASDLKYKNVADQLANEIMQCGIDYFNESQENDSSVDFLKQAQELNETALSIAVGKLTRDRAKDSLATLEEMKDREINQAIQALQSIKDAYEKNKKDIYNIISKEGISIDRFNISNVTDMIENSINWDKATELLVNVIPRENVNKIKNTQNAYKISDYKKLVGFVLDKVNYSYESRIQYLKYWESLKEEIPKEIPKEEKEKISYSQVLKHLNKNIFESLLAIATFPFIIGWYGAFPWFIICLFMDFTFVDGLLYGIFIFLILGVLGGFFIEIGIIKDSIREKNKN